MKSADLVAAGGGARVERLGEIEQSPLAQSASELAHPVATEPQRAGR